MPDTFLSARWENLIMANYEVSRDLLLPFLPPGLELDLYHDKAYVSLVGFMFKRTKLFSIPIPLFGTFEEINLRFYVKRSDGNTIKRGVVFINETVPSKIVAWVANTLYKENYISIPTRHNIHVEESVKRVRYEWKINGTWNHLAVNADKEKLQMLTGSMEEFIFEHYYGYTRLNEDYSQEYQVDHPRWQINKVIDWSIHCDFTSMYGKDFSLLSNKQPASVIIAEGSPVMVKWKRTRFK